MSEIVAAICKAAKRPIALFVDFDGTLVDLAEAPDAILVPDGLPALLEELSDVLGGALALVSGRSVSDIDAHLGRPKVAIAGSHGSEFRKAGGAVTPTTPDMTKQTATIAARLSVLHEQDPRLLVEPKTGSIAVHFRQAPERENDCRAAVRDAIASEPDWTILSGKAVFEARRKDVSKAEAVRALMARSPFAGRTPVFIGDDVTDEDGMAAAIELAGFGVKIGQGETLARFRIADVAGAHALLKALARNQFASTDSPITLATELN
jgi:trehalose 6-phosphate phosphatase